MVKIFEYDSAEEEAVRQAYFESTEPLVLSNMPAKQKRQYIVIGIISQVFDPQKQYSEKEVNAILKPIWFDYVSLRRALIDYRWMSRSTDGSVYQIQN